MQAGCPGSGYCCSRSAWRWGVLCGQPGRQGGSVHGRRSLQTTPTTYYNALLPQPTTLRYINTRAPEPRTLNILPPYVCVLRACAPCAGAVDRHLQHPVAGAAVRALLLLHARGLCELVAALRGRATWGRRGDVGAHRAGDQASLVSTTCHSQWHTQGRNRAGPALVTLTCSVVSAGLPPTCSSERLGTCVPNRLDLPRLEASACAPAGARRVTTCASIAEPRPLPRLLLPPCHLPRPPAAAPNPAHKGLSGGAGHHAGVQHLRGGIHGESIASVWRGSGAGSAALEAGLHAWLRCRVASLEAASCLASTPEQEGPPYRGLRHHAPSRPTNRGHGLPPSIARMSSKRPLCRLSRTVHLSRATSNQLPPPSPVPGAPPPTRCRRGACTCCRSSSTTCLSTRSTSGGGSRRRSRRGGAWIAPRQRYRVAWAAPRTGCPAGHALGSHRVAWACRDRRWRDAGHGGVGIASTYERLHTIHKSSPNEREHT